MKAARFLAVVLRCLSAHGLQQQGGSLDRPGSAGVQQVWPYRVLGEPATGLPNHVTLPLGERTVVGAADALSMTNEHDAHDHAYQTGAQ
jgi:hypothetical protein